MKLMPPSFFSMVYLPRGVDAPLLLFAKLVVVAATTISNEIIIFFIPYYIIGFNFPFHAGHPSPAVSFLLQK